MQKTMRQIIWENQASKSDSIEELFLLWEMMQREEEDRPSDTRYEEIDVGCFHLDGIIDRTKFSGVLYILKEPSMKKYLQDGAGVPVILDSRRYFREYKKGYMDERGYVAGMQKIFLGEEKKTLQEAIKSAAVLYLNKRGGKEVSDSVYLNYANAYKECIIRQIQLIHPTVIICTGEDVFKWVVKEVFCNKKVNKSQKEYMIWKNISDNHIFTADEEYHYTKEADQTAVTVFNMWSPAYHMNKEKYISPKEYLEEFENRIKRWRNETK